MKTSPEEFLFNNFKMSHLEPIFTEFGAIHSVSSQIDLAPARFSGYFRINSFERLFSYEVTFVRKCIGPLSQNVKKTLRKKCPNTEFFLVRIFPYSD